MGALNAFEWSALLVREKHGELAMQLPILYLIMQFRLRFFWSTFFFVHFCLPLFFSRMDRVRNEEVCVGVLE